MSEANDGKVLADWWHDRAQDEINRTVPKAVEYGAGDLEVIGATLRRLGVADGPTSNEELGIFFYLLGKLVRWEQAICDGRAASDDTLFDIGVYLRMAQRVRDVGGWPWAKTEGKSICGDRFESQVNDLVCLLERGHTGAHCDEPVRTFSAAQWFNGGEK